MTEEYHCEYSATDRILDIDTETEKIRNIIYANTEQPEFSSVRYCQLTSLSCEHHAHPDLVAICPTKKQKESK